MNKLLVCPFCGSSNLKLFNYDKIEAWKETYVQCQNCSLIGPNTVVGEEAAAKEWNTRAPITLFLSRRNLQVLLSKLDRKAAGEETACTIIKHQNELDPEKYQQTTSTIIVTAVEDVDYYIDRPAGAMLPADEPKNKR